MTIRHHFISWHRRAARTGVCLATGFALAACHTVPSSHFSGDRANAERVVATRGLVAFWDFEADGKGRMLAKSDPASGAGEYPLLLRRIGDPRSYTLADWPYSADNRARIRYDRSGPFGHALRLDTGHLYAESPRASFDGGPLDLTGRKPFTLIAWVKFVGSRHMIAGIWDEGGWDRYAGRRQVALFAGLFGQKGVIAHISATGAASYPQSGADGAQYARRRAIDGQPFANDEWVATAMTFDPAKSEVVAWLNGKMMEYAVMDPVEQDAYGLKVAPPSNPYRFESPVFGPLHPTLKFNGYDWESTGIAEHRLVVDLSAGEAVYERDVYRSNDRRFRVELTVHSAEGGVADPVSVADIASGARMAFDLPDGGLVVGDRIVAVLSERKGADWEPVGSPVAYTLREGAPFTIGRALGLGNGTEKIEEGSQLYVDGVAVFDRVLSPAELRGLAFGLRSGVESGS